MLASVTLPEGFRELPTISDRIAFEHIATGKRGSVGGVLSAVTPDDQLQDCVTYQCARVKLEAATDVLWARCGEDMPEFKRRKDAGEHIEIFHSI